MSENAAIHWSSRAALLAAAAGLVLGACAKTPFQQDTEDSLRNSVRDAMRRELADAQRFPDPVVTSREDGTPTLGIRPETLSELEKMAGPTADGEATPPLGIDLFGQPVSTHAIDLRSVLQTTASNNLAIQFARLGPAIGEAQVLAAEAAFDWTFFNNFQYSTTDQERISTAFGGGTGSPNTDVSNALSNNLGLRKPLIAGGRFTVQQDLSYIENRTRGQTNNPDPASQAALVLQWDQPLLRNFGSDFNQQEIRLARSQERQAIQTLRRDMIRTLTDAERTYWSLTQAYSDLRVLQRLLDRGERVRDQLQQRARIDANQAQIAEANSRVQRRRADVLRAQTQLRLLSDRLKALMNDPGFPVGGEVVLIPLDNPPDQPVQFSLSESLGNAVQYRPEVTQAVLAIDDAGVRQIVADNQRRPDLVLRLQSRFNALDENLADAWGDQFDGEFIDYLAGLNFEVPIGQRRGEAEFRRRRIERAQTVLAYRNTIQQIVGEVKSALDRVMLNYALIGQTRTSRIAAAETLRVIQVEKEVNEGITVERLDLELNRQEALAQAERDETQALVEYHTAIADLFAAMGTTMERNNIRLVVPTSAQVNWAPESSWDGIPAPSPATP